MMKILLLNPHLHEAPILSTLQKLGVAVIVCSDFKECELVHKFHSTSITLFVGHDEDGVKMNELLKTNPRFSRTPVILTTSKWTEQECIDHQGTPFAANAYLRMPVDDKDFIHVIDEILGTELSHGKGFQISDDLVTGQNIPIFNDKPFAPQDQGSSIQIEDAASVYGVLPQDAGMSGDNDPLGLNISLDAPNFDLDGATGGGTKEMSPAQAVQIAESDGPTVLAVPIQAANFSDEPAFIQDLSMPSEAPLPALDEPFFGDEQATRLAVMPASEGGPTGLVFSAPESPAPESFASESLTPESSELDSEALEAMPYLGRPNRQQNYSNPLDYREPMDDAVVPGGAATAPDVDTLKKYLYLREQDVTALSAQLRQAREQIDNLSGLLRSEKSISSEFAYLAQEQDRRINGFEKEKAVALESAQKELEEVKFEMKRRSEKIRVMELQVKEATDATEKLKERVRGDIRKIRTREKELENRLEIMKKDSEALLGSREQKIIELKRKLDLIEFNADLLQDQLEKERRMNTLLRDKLAKAAQIVRVAGGLLSPEEEALLSNKDTAETASNSAA